MSVSWYVLMWIPGTLLGIAIGILGAVLGIRAARGKLRPSALTVMHAMMAVSASFVIIGVAAVAMNQPWGIWYGFLLPGLTGFVVLAANLPVVKQRIREQSFAGS